MAQAIIGTRLGQSFENEEFWSTVVLFFVRNPMLDPAHVGPIVDYIHHQKYVPQQVVLPGGEVEERPPAQPNFSMKSRSIPKLLRGVEEWHEELARQVREPEEAEGSAQSGKKRRPRIVMWEHSSIGEFLSKEENRHTGERWTQRAADGQGPWERAGKGGGQGVGEIAGAAAAVDEERGVDDEGVMISGDVVEELIFNYATAIAPRRISCRRR